MFIINFFNKSIGTNFTNGRNGRNNVIKMNKAIKKGFNFIIFDTECDANARVRANIFQKMGKNEKKKKMQKKSKPLRV